FFERLRNVGDETMRSYVLTLVAAAARIALGGTHERVLLLLQNVVAGSSLIQDSCNEMMTLQGPSPKQTRLINDLKRILVILVELLTKLPSSYSSFKTQVFIIRNIVKNEAIQSGFNQTEQLYVSQLDEIWDNEEEKVAKPMSVPAEKKRATAADECEN